MSLIAYVRAALSWIWRSKLKFFLAVVSAVAFTMFIFPYDDLTDLFSAQVSAASRNTVFLQFDRLRMSIFPQPGIQLEKVYVETLSAPGLTVDEVTITPSISALISQKPHGHASAKGLLKGDVDITVGGGGTSERGAELTRLNVQARRLSLQDLRQLAKLPMMLKGRLELETKGTLDLAFGEQPDIELNMKISQFEMPPSNVPTQFGEMTLPEIKLSGLELKGKLSGGRFLIENARLGGPGDDLNGTIKGTMNIDLQNSPVGLQPQFGPYSLEIDLQPSTSFRTRASFMLNLLDRFQNGDRYRFKLSGIGLGGPPNMNPLR